MKKRFWALFVFIFSLTLLIPLNFADEGMWPISDIHKLDLRSKGLEISADEIFNPQGLSLIDAVVQVGATGSFVSPDGLIITNHHVAYVAVQAVSPK